MHSPSSIVRHSIIAVSVAGVFYIAWQVRDAFLIAFGGVIVACIIVAFSEGIAQLARLPHKAAVGIAVIIILVMFGGLSWWGGEHFLKQLDQIWNRLPQATGAFIDWLRQFQLGDKFLAKLKDMNPTELVPWGKMAGYTTALLSGLGTTLLIMVLGVYLAAAPYVYTKGLVRLIPPVYRQRSESALLAAGQGLRLWLLGQLAAMLIIGVLTGAGLMMLGVPLAFTLGVLAGITEFIPLIGPIGFGILAIIMAFIEGPGKALQVALLVLLIQQLESNVITPVVQKQAVSLPPALALVAFLVFGMLFGILGIIFAVPLTVTLMILVDELYIKQALQQEAEGEGGES